MTKLELELGLRKNDSRQADVPEGAPQRALVIDDEEDMRVLIYDALGAADIDSVILGEGVASERHIREEKFDVVFVGLGGSSDGLEMVRNIRRSGFNQRTPIIVISKDQHPQALSRGFEAGATFFVYKPIDRAHLAGLIRVTRGTVEREKRRFRRIPVKAKVILKSRQSEVEGETLDLSLNGALVTARQLLSAGSDVEISIYIGDEKNPIVGQGRVMRVLDETHMGILFEQLSARERARLQEYLLPLIEPEASKKPRP